MLLLKLAANGVPPVPAAPLDTALNKEGLHALLACCPHAKLTKKTHLRRKPAAPVAPPFLPGAYGGRSWNPHENHSKGGRSFSECRWNAM